MVLILTNAGDAFPAVVIAELQARGVPWARFDTSAFPCSNVLTLRFNDARDSRDSAVVHLDDRLVDLADVSAVWNRRPTPPVPDPALAAEDREFVAAESRHVLTSLWSLLGDRFWVTPSDADRAAEHKPYQLATARACGLETPKTLITNDPQEAVKFLDQCGGQIVYKSVRHYTRRQDEIPLALFTTVVDRAALEGHLDGIRLAPCLFQDYVPKRVELRAHVIGDRIFTSAIDSQSDEFARHDWRRNLLRRPLPQEPFELPADISAKVHELMRRLGLVFGCLDLILTPDDRYVFLEINPNGQWYWVEQETGLPLLHHFVDMLAAGRAAY